MNEFKLIVAGGRDFNDPMLLERVLIAMADVELADKAVSLVSGMARGADLLAHTFAKAYGIQCYEFPARWKHSNGSHNPSAGFIRNEEMGRYSDGLLAFWDGKSSGTKHMINYMHRLNKPVTLIKY